MNAYLNTVVTVLVVAGAAYLLYSLTYFFGRFSKESQNIDLSILINKELSIKDPTNIHPERLSDEVRQWSYINLPIERKKLLIQAGIEPQNALTAETLNLTDEMLQVMKHLKQV